MFGFNKKIKKNLCNQEKLCYFEKQNQKDITMYDEILKSIEYSTNLSELFIAFKMLRKSEEDLTKEDYQELNQLIINKEVEWK